MKIPMAIDGDLSKLERRESDGAQVCAQDIANWYGWSRWKAWRWLVALERKHGATVVQRRGRKLFTSREGLERVAAQVQREIDPRIERRLADIEAKLKDQDARLNGISREQIEFRRKSNAWFERQSQSKLSENGKKK